MIRQFNPSTNAAEFQLLLPAYLKMANASDALKFLSFTGQPFTEDQVAEWLSTHTEHGVEYYAFCSDDDQIQGIATVKMTAIVGFELLGLIVLTAQRKKGIGKALIGHILNVAAQKGYKSVDVSVFAETPAMLRLVLSQGFIPVSMAYHARFDGADVVNLKCYL